MAQNIVHIVIKENSKVEVVDNEDNISLYGKVDFFKILAEEVFFIEANGRNEDIFVYIGQAPYIF